jgi:CubicO group peptidase (beta-lactamase class C family)
VDRLDDELPVSFDRRVTTLPPEAVTSRLGGQPEVDPAVAGLSPRAVASIWRAVERMYLTGLYPAIGVALLRRGHVVLDRAIGHARGNPPGGGGPRVLAAPTTLFNLFSASKCVTAMLIHLLDERRQIHLDDPIAEYVPGFGRHGKQWITIRHVLTHRAGIPTVRLPDGDLDLLHRPGRVLELLCEARPAWRPGRRLAYHALTGGFVLQAVIERVTGAPIGELLADAIARPIGLTHFRFGVAPEERARVAENAFTGLPPPPPLSTVLRRAFGVGPREAVAASNDPRFLSAVVPAGNLHTTAFEAARFMELLLRGGTLDGVRVFEPRTIQRAVAEQSYLEVDLTMGVPVRYGMGFMLGGDAISVYGVHTPLAFGHLGFTNVILYADPERDLSCCVMTSGKPFLAAGILRAIALMNTIARRCPRDWGRGRS